jgi:hypothetical protein
MLRWLEEFELKHAEFIKSINSFQSMADAWNTLANTDEDKARAAFARYRSNAYLILHDQAVDLFAKTGERRFVKLEGGNLVTAVRAFRETELDWFQELINGEALASVDGEYPGRRVLPVLIIRVAP